MWELESEIEYGGTGRGEGGPWYAMLGGWTEERKNALFLLKSVEQSVRYMVLHTVPWWDAMWKLEREIEDGGTGPGDSRGGM
eukprot:865244-Rhodomonas_salina.2